MLTLNLMTAEGSRTSPLHAATTSALVAMNKYGENPVEPKF
jgi:hypothetical protein